MKSASRFMLMVLAFGVAAWAQSTSQNPTGNDNGQKAPTAQSETKSGCPCCQKMEGGENAMSCCEHHDAAGSKAGMSCCSGKDGESCMKGDKSAKASCFDGKCCKGEASCCKGKDAKNCCAGSGKDDKMAMACCGQGQCGHHAQETMDK